MNSPMCVVTLAMVMLSWEFGPCIFYVYIRSLAIICG
jgi:hypothetical protein